MRLLATRVHGQLLGFIVLYMFCFGNQLDKLLMHQAGGKTSTQGTSLSSITLDLLLLQCSSIARGRMVVAEEGKYLTNCHQAYCKTIKMMNLKVLCMVLIFSWKVLIIIRQSMDLESFANLPSMSIQGGNIHARIYRDYQLVIIHAIIKLCISNRVLILINLSTK